MFCILFLFFGAESEMRKTEKNHRKTYFAQKSVFRQMTKNYFLQKNKRESEKIIILKLYNLNSFARALEL